MSWIKSTFSDFPNHPNKKRKVEADQAKKQVVDFGEIENKILLKRWKPKKKEDLVVHKKKVEEIECWLQWIKKGTGSSILLITGPPGCGKFTTLKVLCSHLDINLIEWIPQILSRSYNSENGGFCESDISVFEEFVLRATRYSNVLNSQTFRLITIKDIPNGFIKDSNLFHKFLDTYTAIDKLYLAFITTDVTITRDLFNETTKTKYNIKAISFNPLTQKSVKTALQKLSNDKFSEYINEITLSCNGDLRNAIATLEFLTVKDKIPQKKEKKKHSKDVSLKKEDSIDLFHGLGRVLYSKRETNGKLSHCPLQIGDSFTSSPELFVGMLQQNYLNTFSSIHEVAKASEKLSISNLITSDYKDTMTSRSLGTIISTYGLMHYNSKPIKKFQQFDKPGKVTNMLLDFKCGHYENRDNLPDLIFYGKLVPNFVSSNKELLSKCSDFK